MTATANAEKVALGYHPGLDGLRAVAVVAVMVFHGQIDQLSGGFLGVDLFFVLSGFLITSLLLAERERSGRIDLGQFWLRRAKRLLPAVLVLLVAVCAYAAFVAERDRLTEIRWDAIASLFYVANWRFIASGHSYFDTVSAPSPVQHLWSLAVEEQWYLVWPLVCTAVLRVGRGRRSRPDAGRWLAVVVAIGTAASMAAMLVLSTGPGGTTRAYYGTDARAQALLIGSGLAIALRPFALRGRSLPAGAARRALAAVAGIGAFAMLAAFVVVDEGDRWMYQGGFAAFAIAAAATMAGVVCLPELDRWLGVAPLRWIGARSYGLYLWHWPAGLVITSARTGLHGWARFAVASAAAVAATELSYRLIERPIRTGTFTIPRPVAVVPSAIATVVALIVVSTLGASAPPEFAMHSDAPPPPVVMEVPTELVDSTSTSTATTSAPVEATPSTVATAMPAGPEPTTPATAPPTKPPPPRHPRRVLLMGDSVAVSLRDQLGKDLVAKRISFTSIAFPGCGVVTGTPVNAAGETIVDCPTIAVTQSETVRTARPDLVVLSSTWEGADRRVGDVVYRSGTPEWREKLLELFDHTIERATSRGARVALVIQPDITDGASVSADQTTLDALHRINDVLRAQVERHPGQVTVIDIGDVVCPSTPCPPSVNGVAYRPRDGRHFQMPEAAPVAQALADRLADLDLNRLEG